MSATGVSMEIGGRAYTLTVELADLAKGEAYYRSQGGQCNLVVAIPAMRHRAYAATEVFACSLLAHHPDTVPASLIALGCLQEVADALWRAWPATTAETREAHEHLVFDLESLADAAEQFQLQGEGMPLASLMGGLGLASVVSIFPCALRQFRPDLTFAGAQKLMSLESVYLTAAGMARAFHSAAPKVQERFALRSIGYQHWTGIANA